MTPVEQLVANGHELISFEVRWATNPAGNESITLYNPDGSGTTYTKTVPNLAKFTNSVTSSIKNEMHKFVYVDETKVTNGDGSIATPFNNVVDAVLSIPEGGYVEVRIVGVLTLKSSSPFSVYGRYIRFVGTASTSSINFIIDSTNVCISAYNGSTIELAMDFTVTNNFDTVKRRAVNLINNANILISKTISGAVPKITIGNNTEICWIRNNSDLSIIAMDVIDLNSTNKGIATVRSGGLYVEPLLSNILFNGVATASLVALTTEIGTRVFGIVKTNSVPVNVISNLQF